MVAFAKASALSLWMIGDSPPSPSVHLVENPRHNRCVWCKVGEVLTVGSDAGATVALKGGRCTLHVQRSLQCHAQRTCAFSFVLTQAVKIPFKLDEGCPVDRGEEGQVGLVADVVDLA